ncbi:MAG: sensor histidine kinase [Chloroflexota bacterium]
MPDSPETPRVLRIAAWMWVGYLAALLTVDALIYSRLPRLAISLYYGGNGLAALFFLGLAYWDWARKRLGETYLPLMILLISGAPILLHHTLVPRFPPGPLASIEGMALRQFPVLFIGLALTAWQYGLAEVLLFSIGTAALEMGILLLKGIALPNSLAGFFFVVVVRTVSFTVIGLFINQLVSRLRAQGESLRQANAQLSHYASTLENLTVSRERNRMARELHDTLAHTLTGLSVTLETVKAYWDVDVDQARALLDKSLATTRNGLEETRRALRSLRASPLEDLGLGLALRQMAESAAVRVNLDLELALPDPMPSLAPDVEQCLYRIAQESVENVVHHANAKRLTLRLEPGAGRWILTVQDDGLGFDPRDKVSTGHFGLVGMKERAELSGGKLTIDSQKGKGTKVVLEI